MKNNENKHEIGQPPSSAIKKVRKQIGRVSSRLSVPPPPPCISFSKREGVGSEKVKRLPSLFPSPLFSVLPSWFCLIGTLIGPIHPRHHHDHHLLAFSQRRPPTKKEREKDQWPLSLPVLPICRGGRTTSPSPLSVRRRWS